MADPVLFFHGKLCGSTAIFRKIKDRVIAKAILPFFLVADAAFHGSTDCLSSAIRESCRNSTYKTCGTFLIGYTFQTLDQVCVFNMIRSILTHIACGIDSRLFVQIVDLQTGIICQNDLAGHFTDCFCLDHGIFFKAFSVFINIRMDPGILQGKDLQRRIRKYPSDFLHFILISGSKNDLFHSLILPFFGGRGPRNW